MKICVLGASGFLGSELCENLKKNNKILKINLSKFQISNEKELLKYIKKISNQNVIINCAASLRPKTYSDFWINQYLSFYLLKFIKKNKIKCKYIHISTNDVLIKKLNDNYSNSKRFAEKKIKNLNCIILRLPLLYKKNYYENNSVRLILHKYLQFWLPVYPMLYPGALYQPLEIKKISKFVSKITKKKIKKGVFNLAGNKKYSLWNIFEKISKIYNKKTIKINTKIIHFLCPKFLICNKRIIVQLLSSNQTKIRNKIIL